VERRQQVLSIRLDVGGICWPYHPQDYFDVLVHNPVWADPQDDHHYVQADDRVLPRVGNHYYSVRDYWPALFL
jgi:hypothetical protein